LADRTVSVRIQAEDAASRPMDQAAAAGRRLGESLDQAGKQAATSERGFSIFGKSLNSLALRFSGINIALNALVRGLASAVRSSELLGRFQTTVESLAGSLVDGIDQGARFVQSLVAIREEAGRFQAIGDLFRAVGTAIGGVLGILEQLLEGWSIALGKVEEAGRRAGQATIELVRIVQALPGVPDFLSPETLRLWEQRIATQQRSMELARADAAAQAQLDAILKSHRVTLGDLVDVEARRAAELAAIETALARGLISETQHARLLAIITETTRQAAAETRSAATATTEHAQASAEAAAILEELAANERALAAETRGTIAPLQQQTNAARQAAAALAQYNLQLGGSGLVARSSSGQNRLDAAVAAGQVIRVVQGGTRARIVNGGSVLLGRSF